MRKGIARELVEAIARIDRPGTFCTSGSVPAILPGLEVKGLGPVGLPLTANQAEELKTHCEQAPYGKGEKTFVDTNVRRVWRMKPARFSLTNPDWERLIGEIVARVRKDLGLETQQLESHLYDLLLYERGSFFLPHRDGEKHDRMVATLVVVLPSSYEGGALVVRHDGHERAIDFRTTDNNPFQVHFAAFYADCEHEVRPLRKGYRLCLVYNLALAKSRKKPIHAPRDSEHLKDVTALLREWAADVAAEKLVITLDHQYTKDGIAWDTLKGEDRAKARILSQAARDAGCKAYLALLTFWESGMGEDDGGYGSRYGRRRWYEDQEDDEGNAAGEYTMVEVLETKPTAEGLVDAEGNALPIGTLTVNEDQLLEPDVLKDVAPEEEYEGYTGNEGTTLERWYRHAAIVVWPERRHFEVLCDRDSRAVVPVLSQMVEQWRKAGAKDEALQAQCTRLAAAILDRWTEQRFAPSYYEREPRKPDGLFETLVALGDPALIGAFLGGVMVKDVTVVPGAPLAPVCQTHGWETFRQELLTLMEATTNETMERNVRLLEELCSFKPRKKQGWNAVCGAVAQGLISAIETIGRARAPSDWRAREVDHGEVLAGLIRALILTEQAKALARILSHAQETPKRYPLTPVQVRAFATLAPWLKKHVKKPYPPLALDRLVPRAVGSAHGARAGAAGRLPARGQDHLQMRRVRRAEAAPSGSARVRAPGPRPQGNSQPS